MLEEDFEASYSRIFGSGTRIGDRGLQFFEIFYQRFLANPEVAGMFRNTDMVQQVRMLRQSFFRLVGLSQGSQWTPELERLAEMHQRLGISGALYDVWLDSVLAAVQVQDNQANERTLLAWRLALQPGLTRMRYWVPRS